jgi:two-component system, OmpR family, response regulator
MAFDDIIHVLGTHCDQDVTSADATQPLRVLVVDDEADIRDMVGAYLQRQGVDVVQAACEADVVAALDRAPPDVTLLDVNLGNEDGFAIARRLRSRWHGGLLMVTGRADTVDRVVGLEIGADDYVTKPFDLRELLARVRSVARRTNVPASSPAIETRSESKKQLISFDRFKLDPERRELKADDGTHVELTTGEFDLLHALAMHPGIVRTRDQLLQQTHNRDAAPFDRTIDVQIGRLRKKLGDDGKSPQLIKAVRGVGYVFTPRKTS